MKKFFIIPTASVHLAQGEKILKKKDYGQLATMKEVKERLEKEMSQQLEETMEKCKQLEKQARERGYQEALTSLNEHIFRFDDQIKAIRLELIAKIVPLALTAAKKIVSKELELHPDTIIGIVQDVLKPITQSKKIIIFVNKNDRETIEENKKLLAEPFEKLDSFSIQESPDIAQGGCIIETETGIINASLENLWRALEAAFLRYMKEKK